VPKTTIRFAIVDDHHAVSEAIIVVLTRGGKLSLAGRYSSLREAEIGLPKVKPAIVIVDWRLGDGVATKLLHAMKARLPNAKWLLFTAWPNVPVLRACIAAGIHGCVSKSANCEQLALAIERLLSGDTYYCEASMKSLLKILGGPEQAPRLGVTERDILRSLVTGLDPKQIADQLDLSVKTVHNSMARMRRSLRLRSTVELARYAVEQGIAPPY
jgi:DNA-binding NarL/FixJ family response regulator